LEDIDDERHRRDGAGRDEIIAAEGPNVLVYKWSGTAWSVTANTTDSCCLGQLRTTDVNGDRSRTIW